MFTCGTRTKVRVWKRSVDSFSGSAVMRSASCSKEGSLQPVLEEKVPYSEPEVEIFWRGVGGCGGVLSVNSGQTGPLVRVRLV